MKISIASNLITIYRKIYAKKPFVTLTTSLLALGIMASIASGLFFFIFVYTGYFGNIPTAQQLENIKIPQASTLFADDNSPIASYYKIQRRNTTYQNISTPTKEALIATEDIRFYQHNGIDFQSLARVFWKSILLQNKSSGGGSTITQQLAKNLFPRKSHGILTIPIAKINEFIIASRIEKIYDKEQIIHLYLNTVPFGDGIHGIKLAADHFFDTTTQNLSTHQAACLIGLLKANSFYNPIRHPKRAIKRRNIVLKQMHIANFLDKVQYDSISQLPLDIKTKTTKNNIPTSYFQQFVFNQLQPILSHIPKPDGQAYNLKRDGLNIFTTLNPKIQYLAHKSLNQQLELLQKEFNKNIDLKDARPTFDAKIKSSNAYQTLLKQGQTHSEIIHTLKKTPSKLNTLQKDNSAILSQLDSIKFQLSKLHAAMLVAEPSTGKILAWVGGKDFSKNQYDHVLARRQVGSCFKPIVYAAALEQGVPPCTYLYNRLVSYTEYDDWTPKNSNHTYGGLYTLQGSLKSSINATSVDLTLKCNLDSVAMLAEQLGIYPRIPSVPSVVLGTPSIALLNMIQSYSTIANKGLITPLEYISHVTNAEGEILLDFRGNHIVHRVLSQSNAKIITHFLQAVVDSGTAHSLRSSYKFDFDIAAKTGTSQNQSDGWFIGFTPKMIAGVWVGSSYPSVHWSNLAFGQGAATALPIWAQFVSSIRKDPSLNTLLQTTFDPLDNEELELLNCPEFIEENKYNNYLAIKTIFPDLKVNEYFRMVDFLLDNLSRKKSDFKSKLNQKNNNTAPIIKRKPQMRRKRNFFDRLFKRKN